MAYETDRIYTLLCAVIFTLVLYTVYLRCEIERLNRKLKSMSRAKNLKRKGNENGSE